MCPRERFPSYKSLSRLILCYKKDWATLLDLCYTCYPLRIILSQNYLLPIIPVLAKNTLLKIAYHFLLLLIGFNTLTYRKDYDRSPMLVGHLQASWEVVVHVSKMNLTNPRSSGDGSHTCPERNLTFPCSFESSCSRLCRSRT